VCSRFVGGITEGITRDVFMGVISTCSGISTPIKSVLLVGVPEPDTPCDRPPFVPCSHSVAHVGHTACAVSGSWEALKGTTRLANSKKWTPFPQRRQVQGGGQTESVYYTLPTHRQTHIQSLLELRHLGSVPQCMVVPRCVSHGNPCTALLPSYLALEHD